MNVHKTSLCVVGIAAIGVLAGCVSAPAVTASASDRTQLPSVQARAFDTGNREQVLRSVMATLQDLGFAIEKVDSAVGSVAAMRLEKYALRMTVTVETRGKQQVVVRANAQYEDAPILEPKPYQDFFAALDNAMSPTSHTAD
ncbi:MAG: hypothetical protein LAO05_10605 [Acidobacteriia bacterium]|nr:hypothetical protein [Terriglobia bacterium]